MSIFSSSAGIVLSDLEAAAAQYGAELIPIQADQYPALAAGAGAAWLDFADGSQPIIGVLTEQTGEDALRAIHDAGRRGVLTGIETAADAFEQALMDGLARIEEKLDGWLVSRGIDPEQIAPRQSATVACAQAAGIDTTASSEL